MKYLTQEQLDILEQALCSAEGLGTLERNKQKVAATSKRTKPVNRSIIIIRPDSGGITPAATADSVATPTRRPLSAQQSPPTGAEASSIRPPSPSHPPRRHSYNLDSRDPAANTVFEPLPVSNEPGAAASLEPERSQAVGVALEEEPFPNLGTNQPVENTLPSSSSTHLLLPPPVEQIPSTTSSLTPPTPDSASRDAKPATKRLRAKGPAGFPSAEDLMHRLFLGISGVADQLQTNHAKDLRVILKNVFYVCQNETESEDEEEGDVTSVTSVTSYPRESSQTKYSGGVNDLEPCTPEPQSPNITQSKSGGVLLASSL